MLDALQALESTFQLSSWKLNQCVNCSYLQALQQLSLSHARALKKPSKARSLGTFRQTAIEHEERHTWKWASQLQSSHICLYKVTSRSPQKIEKENTRIVLYTCPNSFAVQRHIYTPYIPFSLNPAFRRPPAFSTCAQRHGGSHGRPPTDMGLLNLLGSTQFHGDGHFCSRAKQHDLVASGQPMLDRRNYVR